MQVLLNYKWPGNVRELENTIERLVIMSGSERITAADLPVSLSVKNPGPLSKRSISLVSNIEEIERTEIIEALKKTGWVQTRAARLLGITPRQIGYKIRKYSISPESV